jgi:hypothetical protein
MGKLTSISPLRWLVVGVLCLSLGSCGIFNPRPPHAIVEAAIAQRLAQAQVVFDGQPIASFNQPSSSAPTANLPASTQVGGVRVDHYHRVNVGEQWALEVTGTYRLRSGDLSKAQRRQARPFDIYLQRDRQERWYLLTPEIEAASTSAQWRTIPLLPAV